LLEQALVLLVRGVEPEAVQFELGLVFGEKLGEHFGKRFNDSVWEMEGRHSDDVRE